MTDFKTRPTVFGVNLLLSGDTIGQGTPGTSGWLITGDVAGGVTDSGNPVKVGGVAAAGPASYQPGQRAELQTSLDGRLLVDIGTLDSLTQLLEDIKLRLDILNSFVDHSYTPPT